MSSLIESAWATQHKLEVYFKYKHKNFHFINYRFILFIILAVMTLSHVHDILEFILLINTLTILAVIFLSLNLIDYNIFFFKD